MMRSENGIPRPFQPSNLAQEVKDLRRDLAELKARRTFVSVERIVEGGTINENVGKQLTETVQKDIVIDRDNLAEAALTDVVVTGSISSRGKTAEDVPRDIDVRMTTVARTLLGKDSVPNPAVIFITEDVEEANFALAPGFYSPDGRSLNLRTAGLAGGANVGVIDMSPEKINIVSDDVKVGPFLGGGKVTIGVPETIFGGPTNVSLVGNVNLVGSVKVNGDRVMKTVTPNIPAGQQPIELIANGSASTNPSGEFTIMFPAGTFPNACTSIFIVPNSGGGTIPVVNGSGALTRNSCQAVQPGNGNKAITYSYRAIGY